MAGDYIFIYEEPRYKKILTVLGAVFVLILVSIVVLTQWTSFKGFVASYPVATHAYEFFQKDVIELNPLGIFYITFIGDLFFNPLPPEIFFYSAMLKGQPLVFLTIAALIGTFLSQLVNYFLGRKFSIFFMNFVSKKNLYKIRRKVNRYGVYAVFIFNVLPLPAPLLTFGLGMTRYNFSRLFVTLMIGTVIKYAFLIVSYRFFS